MRILIVEDEIRLAQAIREILHGNRYTSDIVGTGANALAYAESGSYDAMVLDLGLPDIDGLEVARQLRKMRVHMPILMLTARDSLPDKVTGLDSGADDYMTKPFAAEELLARLRALTRRRGEVLPQELSFGDMIFSPETAVLRCGEREVRLNRKEADLLHLLLTHTQILLSKDELINRVWGYDSGAADSNVEAYMSFIRRKLAFVGSGVTIVSVKKQGYRLEWPGC